MTRVTAIVRSRSVGHRLRNLSLKITTLGSNRGDVGQDAMQLTGMTDFEEATPRRQGSEILRDRVENNLTRLSHLSFALPF